MPDGPTGAFEALLPDGLGAEPSVRDPMPGTRRCKAPRGISRITISEEDKHE